MSNNEKKARLIAQRQKKGGKLIWGAIAFAVVLLSIVLLVIFLLFMNGPSKIAAPGPASEQPDLELLIQSTMTAMALEADVEQSVSDEDSFAIEPTLEAPMLVPETIETHRIPEEEDLVFVSYKCDDELIKSEDEIAIIYQWAALKPIQLDEYFWGVEHQIRLNGEEVPIIRDFYGDIENMMDNGEKVFYQSYWMYIGRLEPGEYQVETIITLNETVYDGWEWYEPGVRLRECLLIVE